MKKIKNISLLLIVLLVSMGVSPVVVNANGTGGWSSDARVPGYLDDTFTPFLVADQNRTVHAFTSQWINDGSRRMAVVYRQWSLSSGWTRPVDIILASAGDAQILGVFLDSLDKMHIIFMVGEAGGTSVFYSSAPASNADLATAWSTPILVGESLGLNSAAIIGDDQGNLIIIYSGNRVGNGIYCVTSNNSGKNWTEPSPVFLTYDTALLPYSLRLAINADRQVSATWSVVTVLGVDETLHFANYNISNSKWNLPVELDRRIDLPDYFGPSFPAIVDNGKEIMIMYNGGSPFSGRLVELGRPVQLVRLSEDQGESWSGLIGPFPNHLGRSGEHALILDGNGTPHALFVQRIETSDEDGKYSMIAGIWHSAYLDKAWSNPDRIVTTIAPHDVRAVVCQGNILLVVWREDPGSGKHGVWFSYNILNVPENPVVPLSTVPVILPTQQVSTLTPLLNTPTPLPEDILDEPLFSQLRNSPGFPLVAGIVPVILIVIGTFIAYFFLIKRNQ